MAGDPNQGVADSCIIASVGLGDSCTIASVGLGDSCTITSVGLGDSCTITSVGLGVAPLATDRGDLSTQLDGLFLVVYPFLNAPEAAAARPSSR